MSQSAFTSWAARAPAWVHGEVFFNASYRYCESVVYKNEVMRRARTCGLYIKYSVSLIVNTCYLCVLEVWQPGLNLVGGCSEPTPRGRAAYVTSQSAPSPRSRRTAAAAVELPKPTSNHHDDSWNNTLWGWNNDHKQTNSEIQPDIFIISFYYYHILKIIYTSTYRTLFNMNKNNSNLPTLHRKNWNI